MKFSRRDENDFRAVSDMTGVPAVEVRRAVASFFDSIVKESDALHLDNECRIYSREAFRSREFVRNIPGIGRIGPVYSRYLLWRANESKNLVQEPRGHCRNRVVQDDIENIAGEIISGGSAVPVNKRKGSEFYKRVWLVGTDGKRLARQVIRKEKKNGIQD